MELPRQMAFTSVRYVVGQSARTVEFGLVSRLPVFSSYVTEERPASSWFPEETPVSGRADMISRMSQKKSRLDIIIFMRNEI